MPLLCRTLCRLLAVFELSKRRYEGDPYFILLRASPQGSKQGSLGHWFTFLPDMGKNPFLMSCIGILHLQNLHDLRGQWHNIRYFPHVAGNRCRARPFRYDGIIISMVCSDTACTVRNTDILRYSTGFRGTIDSNGGGKTQAPQGFLDFVGLPEILSWWVVRGSNLRLSA